MRTPVAAGTLLAAVLVLCTAAGCTTASDPDQDLPARRYALEGTVDNLNMWSHQHLFNDLQTQGTGAIPDDAWHRALQRAADGAAKVHLGCASAEVTVAKDDDVGIAVKGCASPGASSAEGCLILAAPFGPADGFVRQQVAGGSPPPTYVESASQAGPDTWYVGRCR